MNVRFFLVSVDVRHQMCGAAGGPDRSSTGGGGSLAPAEAASRAAQARAAAAAPIHPSAANASAGQPASSAPAGVASQADSGEEEKLRRLQAFGVGVTRDAARAALQAAGGNMDLAASLLLEGSFP